MDPLHLIIEASRADQALAAHTTDQDLHTAIARHRPDLWAALAMNPGIHPDLLAWLESQGVGSSPGSARGDADEGAEDGEDDAAQDDAEDAEDGGDDAEEAGDAEDGGDDAEEAGDAAESGDPEAVGDVEETEDAEDGEDDVAQDDAEEAGDAAGSGGPEAVGAAESDDADPGDEPDDGGLDVDNDGEDGAAQDDTEDAEYGGDDAVRADSPETIGFPAPPPSAEDIAAWAETPSAAPEAYEASDLAVSGSVYAPSYQAPVPYQAQPQTQQPRRSTTTRLLVGIIVLLLVIIIGGGGVLLGTHLSGKGSESEAGGQEASGADAGEAAGADAAGGIPSATSTGPLTSCETAPAVQVMSVTDEQGGLTARVKVTSPCAQGDFLDGSAVRINLYGPSSAGGGGLADAVVASGEFDFSRTPLIIPAEGAALDLAYGSGHYFRTAADLAPSGSGGQGVETMTGKVLISRPSPTTLGSQGLVSPGLVSAAETSTDTSGEDAAASAALNWYIEQGRSGVRSSLVGKWTPQLSSKRPGLVAEGQTWDARSALAEFLALRQRYGTAVLVDSDEWPVFEPGEGWWVTLAGIPYSSADEANAWCDAQGYSNDHCLAKKMDTTGPPDGTIKSR
ncbi:variant leucine-rich repeat-containing protein [Actinomyces capricornis]|uniref:Leucine rich repeat variant domain-containing protein n=1 Tax=Actinomyces capricornis TaxID=2755559 RepID=A0ABN6K8J9_9ACTO|nr:hypothetical protein [Actinomyces capricornis]BDA64661.1 hypothetical protein MANAM107_14950 [Actinomyces capricornis]